MATISDIQKDQAVRVHLAELAKSIRTKFTATSYQGDFVNTVTGETFGDRLQVGTQVTMEGVRYLLVVNVLVSRQTGGQVSVRVSAWSLSGNTGKPVGTWVIRRTALKGITLTHKGFIARVGNAQIAKTPEEMTQRITTYLNVAKVSLRNGIYGRPVVEVHTDRDGNNPYDTKESHLLVFGGTTGAYARLTK
jgi:hypothetical protein